MFFQETRDVVKQKTGKNTHTAKKTSPYASFHFVSAFYLPAHLFPTHTLSKKDFLFCLLLSLWLCGGRFSANFRISSISTWLQQLAFHMLSQEIVIRFRPPKQSQPKAKLFIRTAKSLKRQITATTHTLLPTS